MSTRGYCESYLQSLYIVFCYGKNALVRTYLFPHYLVFLIPLVIIIYVDYLLLGIC